MRRHPFLTAAATAVLVTSILPAGTAAIEPTAADRFRELELGEDAKVDPKSLPGFQRANRPVTVMVELAGKPVTVQIGEALDRDPNARFTEAQKQAMRTPLVSLQAEVRDGIRALGGTIQGAYQDVFNGLRVRIASKDAAKLARLRGVVGVHRIPISHIDNANSARYMGVPQAWAETGRTGVGVKIAIIDSGLDYHHKDFGGTGKAAFNADPGTNPPDGSLDNDEFPTAKVIGGYDLVGDAYNPSDFDPTNDNPNPDPDPLDCKDPESENVQHGTHVAATAAGKGVKTGSTTYHGPYNATTLDTVSFLVAPGMAPRAKLLAYRVFGCEGGTDLVVDALERAVRDGAHVINMSLGSPFGRGETVDAVATNNATRAGVTVVASAGNSGPSAYITGSPGVATGAISVAAMDALPSFPSAIIDMPGAQPNITAINANGDDDLPVTGPLNVLEDNPATVTYDERLGCEATDYVGVLPGEIVVTRRGVCARVDRAKHGQAVGADAVIMINSSDTFPPFEGPIPGVTIPFLGVRSSDGPALVAADGQEVTITDGPQMANPGYRRFAPFTSGGPRRVDNAVKPDVTAPGVSVISAAGGTGSVGKSLSGTSMAAPAVAGVAALVKEAHPTWNAVQIKSTIVGTANGSSTVLADYDTRLGGAGVVRARRAVDNVTLATTGTGFGTLSFRYDQLGGAHSETHALRLWNTSASPITYNLASTFNGGSRGAVVTVTPSTVTVPAKSSARVLVTLSISAASVAALPDQEDHADGMANNGYTPLTNIKGAIWATPTVGGAGRYAIRVPFLFTPDPVSAIEHGLRSPYTVSGDRANATVRIRNSGVHTANADVYAWGLQDGNEGYESNDIRAVGVQTLPFGDDRLLVFAVNTHRRWDNISVNEFDVAVDTAPCPVVDVPPLCEDDDPEFRVVGFDVGALFAGSFDGTYAAFVFTGDYSEFISVNFYARVAPNGSTVLLPVLASDLGLTEADSDFRYYAESFAIFDYSLGEGYDLATTGLVGGPRLAAFDAYDPPLSQGQYIPLAPGEEAVLNLWVKRSAFVPGAMKGWMLVSLNDRNGWTQAETIPAGTVP